MPVSFDVHVAPSARKDLKGIEAYTAEKWGERRCDQYMSKLAKRIRALAHSPRMGVVRKDLRGGNRTLIAGEHLIIYNIVDRRIHISRVLHQSMDIDRKLIRSRNRDRADEHER